MKVRKGDTVLVISGKDKGAKGKVLVAYPDRERVLVEGVNRIKKHTPESRTERGAASGGIVTQLLVLAVALVLFIISAAVVFTLNFRPLYYFDVDHLNITAMSGLPREEILQNYNVLIDYNSIFGTKVLNFPTLAMSESGRIHFEEVKNVFGVFEITLIISGILSLAGIIYRHFKKNPGYLLLSGILTVAIPAALGVLIALNWETVFVLFHKIVFHNNYWIFDAATDPVITILPDTFFMHCALMILALVVLGSIICLLAYRHAKHKKTHTA